MPQEQLSWNIVVHPPKASWLPLVVIAVFLWAAAAYFFTRENYFGSALFALFPVLFVAQRFQGPRAVRCVLNEKGVEVNGAKHAFKEFSSYAFVHSEEVAFNRKDGGALHVPFYEEDGDQIEEALKEALPEGEHEEELVEIISRFLRLS